MRQGSRLIPGGTGTFAICHEGGHPSYGLLDRALGTVAARLMGAGSEKHGDVPRGAVFGLRRPFAKEGEGRLLSRPITREEADAIGAFLGAVGQPIRVLLIDALDRAAGELSVQQLAGSIGITAQDASQHLNRLRRDRIVRRRKAGRYSMYRLADGGAALGAYRAVAACWLESDPTVARRAS
jgi:DNA-binding transcriptional ArsR family regulator